MHFTCLHIKRQEPNRKMKRILKTPSTTKDTPRRGIVTMIDAQETAAVGPASGARTNSQSSNLLTFSITSIMLELEVKKVAAMTPPR